ncbi:MAG: hypothetical protein GY719_36540 [bacterium]|nr:hypothetical protein [bacterium]
MAKILIPTFLEDIHATAVALALREKGHEAVLWHGADYPSRQHASIEISKEKGLSWSMAGPDLDAADEHFDIVWYRRPVPPVLPDDVLLHPGDRYLAKRACVAFNRALWEVVAPDAFWVNPPRSKLRSTAKPVQLMEAARAGLEVPPTLCSNDPERIRRFLAEHEGETIYKSFAPAQWKKEDGIALMFTTDVTADDLPGDDILELSSGIFQRKVPKDYELRLTFMGDFMIAAKLLSQEKAVSQTDWKLAFGELGVEPAESIPEAVVHGCREVMRKLGIVFGCFDLIVTPGGDYVFVEVNEMGQFLWAEELNPAIRVLDPFCEFLIHGRPDFDWRPKADMVRFETFREKALEQHEKDVFLHVPKIFHHAADESGTKPDGKAEVMSPLL